MDPLGWFIVIGIGLAMMPLLRPLRWVQSHVLPDDLVVALVVFPLAWLRRLFGVVLGMRPARDLRPPLVAIAAVLLLAGCGTAPWSHQDKVGLNIIKAEWQVPADKQGIKNVEASFGKESEATEMAVKLPDGTEASFKATGIRSADLVKARAAVDTALSADQRAAIENVVPGAIDAILKAVNGL